MKRSATALLALLGVAPALGQQQPQTQGSITWTLSYQVYAPAGPAGSPWTAAVALVTGPVESGQGVLLRLTAAMSGTPGGFDPVTHTNLGSPLTWSPTIYQSSSGEGNLSGFWSGDLNLIGDGGAASAVGTWSNGSTSYAPEVRRRLITWTAGTIGNINGAAQGTGPASVVTDIQPAQFNGDANAIDHSQSAVCWQGLWVPTSYAPRTVNFAAVLGSLGYMSAVAAMDSQYANGYTLTLPLRVATFFGPGVGIQVVPAPGSGALGSLLAIAARRRRRQGKRGDCP
jgi:hypothetical protein